MNFKEYLKYDIKSPSGLSWIQDYSRFKVGDVAGSLKTNGYWKFTTGGKSYQVHRIIWELLEGLIPSDLVIYHIDGNPGNNLISNLRLATRTQNQFNRKSSKGYYFNKKHGKWYVRVNVNGVQTYFGSYGLEEEAASKAIELQNQHYKEFSPNG